MKKLLLSLLVMSALMLSVVPGVFAAVTLGSSLGINFETEDFPPQVWQCDHRVVYDDATEPGRILTDGQILVERLNNYAFEGEQVQWKVLVMDKNGIDKVSDVYVTLDGNIEANCNRLSWIDNDKVLDSCNARILEEDVDWNSDLMAYYECTLTVETVESMDGEYEITVEAVDLTDLTGTMDEKEFWYLNPFISLGVDGTLDFGGANGVRPGTSSYSESVLVRNEADEGTGVLLDMFISGTDFYDLSSSGAKCGTSNVLQLSNFRYYATNGAYSTHGDTEIDIPTAGNTRDKDAEGYVNIDYGIGFNDPTTFYDNMEIIQSSTKLGPYYAGNVLTPGAEMALTFRLNLPEPCNGDFNSGKIYFWGEAI